MPQPTSSDVHVDAILSNISVAFLQQEVSFIAGRVFPLVPVEKQSDKFFTYTKADWFRDEAKKRAAGSESAGSGYGISTDNYFCDKFALHKDVDDDTVANSDRPLDPYGDATRFITLLCLLRREIQWAADFFTPGVWTTDKVGTTDFTKWSDYAASDPITDIEAAKESILGITGVEPNKLVLGYQVWRILKNHPDIVDRYKHVSSDSITPLMVARLFEIDELLVAKAIKNTAAEGATASFAFTAGKNALLCYSAPSPGILAPSGGYVFSWRGVSGGLGFDIGIKRFRMDELESDRIEGTVAFDCKKIAADLGYFFSAAVA